MDGNFGAAVRHFRTKAGLTQEGLAREADLTFATINATENQKRMPGLETAVAMRDALSRRLVRPVTLDELVDFQPEAHAQDGAA